MKTLIVYDSIFGNTEKIAQAIADSLGSDNPIKLAGFVTIEQLKEANLLVFGSPTRSFAATPAMMSLLESIPADGLGGKSAAAFDTRLKMTGLKGLLFGKMIDKGGYAAPILSEQLRSKGAMIIQPPEGFFVQTEKGPLVHGEIERAEIWAKTLL
jgi:flavodoxin